MTIPYLVLKNFLGARDNQAALDCIKRLDSKLTTSTYNHNSTEIVDLNIKKNKNLWLNRIDNDDLELTEYFARYLFNKKLLDVLEDHPELVHINNHSTRQYSTLLTRYDPGDFYDWHTDLDGFVTWSYVCYNSKVEGGEFVLSNATVDQEPKNKTTIPCTNDTLVIFPARYQHRVEQITSGSRYSVQLFFKK